MPDNAVPPQPSGEKPENMFKEMFSGEHEDNPGVIKTRAALARLKAGSAVAALPSEPVRRMYGSDGAHGYSQHRARVKELEKEYRAQKEARANISYQEPSDPAAVMTVEEAAVYYKDAGAEYIKGLMPKQQTGTLFGPSGDGKTLLTLFRNLCLANGVDFLGLKVTGRYGSLYVGLEDPQSGVMRLSAASRVHRLSTDGCLLLGGGNSLNVMAEKSVDAAIEQVLAAKRRLGEELGLELAVVSWDTQRYVHPGHSNIEDIAANAVSEFLKKVVAETGANAEMLNHVPDSDPTREPGNLAGRGSRDYQWRVHKGAFYRVKHRFAKNDTKLATFEVIAVPWKPDPEAAEVPVVKPLAAGVDWADLADGEAAEMAEGDRLRWLDTRKCILVALLEPSDSMVRDKKPTNGWSNAELGRALKARQSDGFQTMSRTEAFWGNDRKDGPLKQLESEGLVVNRSGTQVNGKGFEWDLSEEGTVQARKVMGAEGGFRPTELPATKP